MARRESEIDVPSGAPSVAAAGTLALLSGTFLTVLALPVTIGSGAAVVLTAPSVALGIESATAAVQGPLGAPTGIGWLLHAAVLGLLAGAWLTGAGLLISELTPED